MSELFLLLPEYCDTSTIPSSVYINGISEIDSNAFLQYFTDVMNSIDFFRYERCDKYYDSKNLLGALYPYTVLKEEYEKQTEEYPNVSMLVRASLNTDGFVDWRDEPTESVTRYLLEGIEVTGDMLGEMARRSEDSESVVLFNHKAIETNSPIVLTTSTQKTISISSCCTISEMHQWFSTYRQPARVFVYNPKHGDAHHLAQNISGTGRKAAQLLTDTAETNSLLKLAVGTDLDSALWYKDEKRGCYIYFENQNEIRLAFHGYHLSPGDENYDNIDFEKLNKIHS